MSKPVCPPWNDSSKNLAREVARSLRRHRPTIMTRRGRGSLPDVGRSAFVYAREGRTSFSPSLRDNLRVFSYLLLGSRADVWHFFFAPNPRTSAAARIATSTRRIPSVHTVCSLPREVAALAHARFADVTVVLSRAAEARCLDAGIPASVVRRIPPAIAPLDVPTPTERSTLRATHGIGASAPVWLFPGDLEPGGGAEETIDAFASWGRREGRLVVAYRSKTARSAMHRSTLAARAHRLGLNHRVVWMGDTPRIHELVRLSDLVVLPARSPVAKMDYPLVVLEAMSMEKPVLVAEGTPAAELADAGGALAIPPVADAVAEAAHTLLSDSDASARQGAAARDLVLTVHDPFVIGARYEALYDEVANV